MTLPKVIFQQKDREIIVDEDGQDVVYRKRAHKRKRKIRPKRNGF